MSQHIFMRLLSSREGIVLLPFWLAANGHSHGWQHMITYSQALEGEDLQGVAVLVTRFFGGVKLGAGGLVRAYGGAARDCLRAAPRTTVKARVQLQLLASYEVSWCAVPCVRHSRSSALRPAVNRGVACEASPYHEACT